MKRVILTLSFIIITVVLFGQNKDIAIVHMQQVKLSDKFSPNMLVALTTHQHERAGEVKLLTERRIAPSTAYTIVYNDIHLITDFRKYRITDLGEFEYFEGTVVGKKNSEKEKNEYVYGYKAISEREFFYATRNEGILPPEMEYKTFAWMSYGDKKEAILNDMNFCLEMPPVIVMDEVENEAANDNADAASSDKQLIATTQDVLMLSCKLLAGE